MAGVGLDIPIEADTFHMGPGTLRISRKALHGKIRGLLVERMRAALPEEKQGLIFMQGGKDSGHYDTDTENLFTQEPFFHYLFGVTEGGWFGTLCVRTGRTTLFMPRLPPSYAVWMGRLKTPEEYRAAYGVDAVHFVDEMEGVLAGAGGALGEGRLPCVHVLRGTNTDSGESLPLPERVPHGAAVEADTLYGVAVECRVIKTAEEIEIVRYANAVGSQGHIATMRAARPGLMEYGLESAFLAHCYSAGGCRHAFYTPILASGPNGAVLHYGHAGAPNDRLMCAGDLVLADCGCRYYAYGSDITTTWPVDGKFRPEQVPIYEAVLGAQRAVLAAMRPGVAWPAMQELAYRLILEGLAGTGVLAGGSVDEYLAADLGALFMPHGLGHFLGVHVHDVGGYPANGPPRPDRPGFNRLRTARVLQAGMVITVEPGCYFNPALLLPALEDPAQSRFLVREKVLAYMALGGVRLEDNVVVTEGGCESLTSVPRAVAEVEAVMAGGAWPPAAA